MFSQIIPLIFSLGVVAARETKSLKTLPTISHSLVNLGKMDISIYLNAKGQEASTHDVHQPTNSLTLRSEPVTEEPCPCSSLGNVKNSIVNHPSEILSKILHSNDLFSFNKEPVSSTLCCDSQEHIQEETVFFELTPKQNQVSRQLPMLPFIFENINPSKLMQNSAMKPKAMEIFLFPRKKETTPFDLKKLQPKKEVKKSLIQIVGDKEMRNDFKHFKVRPSVPLSSVKKDLTTQEKKRADDNAQKNSTDLHTNTV